MKATVKDIDVKGKRIIVRVDLNVPLDENCCITNDKRIKAVLPTVRYLLEQGCSLILMSHLGRPKGKVVPEMSLAPVAVRLAEMLDQPVLMAKDCVGDEVKAQAAALKPGEILLLENLRFHPEEEAGDEVFAKELADLAEIYVDDAFGTAHRKHASTAVIAKYLTSVAGLLMGVEIDNLTALMDDPRKPFMAIIGGAKIKDKMSVIKNLLNTVDQIIIGGGMANTFLLAQGKVLGKSLVEEDKKSEALDILRIAEDKGVKVYLPVDVVIARSLDEDEENKTVNVDSIPPDWMALDIGSDTCDLFHDAIIKCKTIVWNGPMGVFENPAYANGTFKVAAAMAEADAFTVVGGGDSVSAVTKGGYASKISHVSTGGGATLKFLEGKEMPAMEVLLDR